MKLWGLGLIAMVAACGSADDTKDIFGAKVCVSGATQECVCPGGSSKGAQSCKDDGSGWGACDCGGGDAGTTTGAGGVGGASGGTAGTGGAGGHAGTCIPRACPTNADDGGAPSCGAVDDGCGGRLNCGCDYGQCVGGTCTCWRATSHDPQCSPADLVHRKAIECVDPPSATSNVQCIPPPGPQTGGDDFSRLGACCP